MEGEMHHAIPDAIFDLVHKLKLELYEQIDDCTGTYLLMSNNGTKIELAGSASDIINYLLEA
jgi:hypothetical protein